jgi:hypothetical protein
MAEYVGRSTDFAYRHLASSMVVFGCLTDTSTDTTQPVDANRARRRVGFGRPPSDDPALVITTSSTRGGSQTGVNMMAARSRSTLGNAATYRHQTHPFGRA